MWFLIKDRENKNLDLMEQKGIPAIVTQTFDEQESEVIDFLEVRGNKVIVVPAAAGMTLKMNTTLTNSKSQFYLTFSIRCHLKTGRSPARLRWCRTWRSRRWISTKCNSPKVAIRWSNAFPRRFAARYRWSWRRRFVRGHAGKLRKRQH